VFDKVTIPMKKIITTKLTIFFLLGSIVVIPLIYSIPAVNEKVAWRVNEAWAQIKYAISPPEKVLFVPKEGPPTESPHPTTTETVPTPQLMPATTPTLVISPTPLPEKITLIGAQHEYQTWNNCGPATLAMALTYWGWDGDQRPIAAFTKPNSRDKNVMPYELSDYVLEETGLEVVYRTGGDIDLLKRLLAAELPVIIEKGFEGSDFDGWMGHYVLVTGYDETERKFIVQDSYYGPNQFIQYEDLESNWRAFNFTYLVNYPIERQKDVIAILGPHFDVEYNNRSSAQVASEEAVQLAGRDRFFAWFNLGGSLIQLRDYAGAALAYDNAFAVYPDIPDNERPWRMMWYQTGPYWAYFYTGRNQDVIDLATTTLNAMSEPVLEESYYWRARALEALGDYDSARMDLQTAIKYHPGFKPAFTRLQQLGDVP
jgi:tetratricopeptide (TPR) repeat protein